MTNRHSGCVLFFCAFVVAVFCASFADEQSDELQVRVIPLCGKAVKPGLPLALAVDFDCRADKCEGILEAWVGERTQYRQIARRTIRLEKGQSRLWLYPMADAFLHSYLVVRLDGVEQACRALEKIERVVMPLPGLEKQPVSLTNRAGSVNLPQAFFPGEDPSRPAPKIALAGPSSWWAGVAAAPETALPIKQLEEDGFFVVNMSGAASFPDRWCGFQVFDVVFWDAHFNARLSKLQCRALIKWIQAGGRFVVIGSRSDVRANAPFPELLPATDAGRRLQDVCIRGMSVFEKQAGLGLVRVAICETNALAGLTARDWALLADTPRPAIDARSYGDAGDLAALEILLGRGLAQSNSGMREIVLPLAVYGLILGVVYYGVARLFPRVRRICVAAPILLLFCALALFHSIVRPGLARIAEISLEIRDSGIDGAGKTTRISCIRPADARAWSFGSELESVFALPPVSNEKVWEQGREDARLLVEIETGEARKTAAISGAAGSDRVFIEEAPLAGCDDVFETDLTGFDGGLSGRVFFPPAAGYTNVFVLYRNSLVGVAPDGALSQETRQIEDLMRVPVRWRWFSAQPSDTFIDDITEWIDVASEAALCSGGGSGRGGVRSAVLPNDFLARWNAPDDRAVLFAFRENKGGFGIPRNVLCLRRIVKVKTERSGSPRQEPASPL